MSIMHPGKIITFYSYKGGAGRSMLLANVAWILASSGKRVLVIDWDLESSGLHNFFRPFLLDADMTSTSGVIDFVWDFAGQALTVPDSPLLGDWYAQHANILRYSVSLQWEFYGGGMLDFVPAGRQGASYSARVNSFDWQNFYERLGGYAFFEAVRDRMRDQYDYVLIDSRTGVSDTAGICTVQFPDSLVVCLTLNRQSVDGSAAVTRSVLDQRRSLMGNPILVFPVPMRIEMAEMMMLQRQRDYVRRAFDSILLASPDVDRYWRSVEIPYVPHYAYVEKLAAFVDDPSDYKSLLSATLRLTSFLTSGQVTEFSSSISPEVRHRVLSIYNNEPV
jgi:MinD-like ATPase involved in chromosome partitioning or flagellar assembly